MISKTHHGTWIAVVSVHVCGCVHAALRRLKGLVATTQAMQMLGEPIPTVAWTCAF